MDFQKNKIKYKFFGIFDYDMFRRNPPSGIEGLF